MKGMSAREGARGRCARWLGTAMVLATLLAGTQHAQAEGKSCTNPLNYKGADCLHAWWDNSPPANTGVAGGSTVGMQNYCTEYRGMMRARVYLEGARFGQGKWKTYRWSGGKKLREKYTNQDVVGVSCCGEAKICMKQEAIPKDNKIMVDTGTEYQEWEVETRMQRYNLCKAHPTSIYCELDPEGDAHRPLNCGDHDCKVADCKWHFERSPAFETCQGENGDEIPRYAISAEDGSSQTCRVWAQCRGYANPKPREGEEPTMFVYIEKSAAAEVWDTDDIVNCSTVGENWRSLEQEPNSLSVDGEFC